MLAARFFVNFAPDTAHVAVAVNTMSALLSAATILLLFWTITHLVRRLIVKDDAESVSLVQMLVIFGSGLCGALAYTWSDTFWFSAVEGEVYAFSSFCTALVFWLILKWEARADRPHSDRYLVLIAYVIGISIAVHLLNLLCIPAIVLVFYYKKFQNPDGKGSLIALLVSFAIIAVILYGLVPGFIEMAQYTELFTVNTLGMSYNSGPIIYTFITLGVMVWAVYELYRQNNALRIKVSFLLSVFLSGIPFIGDSIIIPVIILAALAYYLFGYLKKIPVRIFNVVILSILVIFIGYSSYALLLIRSSANTPMNQNAPDNVFALSSYLNREQYGERPLFYGQTFSSGILYQLDNQGVPRAMKNEGKNLYGKTVKESPDDPDKYEVIGKKISYEMTPELNMLFPRMYDSKYADVYRDWTGMTGTPVQATTYVDAQGNPFPGGQQTKIKPTFLENLKFFFNYQLNHMYWRYFMWNFAGRQNDIQGNGEPHLGNWISGIPVIDNARLGDQSALPDEYGKGNKGHNVFYMMPLLLGLIGLLYQALYHHRNNPLRGIQQFWVVFFLFFMTGIAIVLYLNQTPGQPRERDYAFAGSFYAFAIWIGMGVPAIGVMLRNLFTPKPRHDAQAAENEASEEPQSSKGVLVASAAIACVIGLIVPLQIVSQTWDDHDRSGRYTTRDFGFNYLSSLDDNAIIFTNGDNDTFPLWYAQEVENFRPDVRVVNLSYLTTDWYANQMHHPTSGAAAIPMTAKPQEYAYERLAYSFIVPANNDTTESTDALGKLYMSDAGIFGYPGTHYLADPKQKMTVDRAAALERYSSGNDSIDSLYIAPYITDIFTDLSASSGINQSRILSLDMIANSVANNWERPTYFATTVPTSYYLGLTPYLGASGMAYEVTPFRTPRYNVTADKSYCKIVADYRWGGLDQPGAEKLYLDETVRRMVASVRSGIYSVVEDLMATGSLPASEKAKEVAKAKGFDAPATRYDMARQLLDMLKTKLPSKVSPYDGMLGLYYSRAYLDLYLATGNQADLDAAEAEANAEADRYARLVKYATTLRPEDLALLGAQDTYALQYLGEAVSLKNYIDMLRKASPEQIDEVKAAIASTSAESDIRLAPLLYIDGYDYKTLEENIAAYPENQRGIIQTALDILRLNEQLGIDPTSYGKAFTQTYGFTPQQWGYVID